MTNEEKAEICKLLRKETTCGLATASKALDKLIEALKNQPPIVMDNINCLNITWENTGYKKIKSMTPKQKQLLLKDLCGRMPFEPMCEYTDVEDGCKVTAKHIVLKVSGEKITELNFGEGY